MRRAAAPGLLLSAALTLISLRTLWPAFGAALPGPPGDNVAFLWNTWWASQAWRQFPVLLKTASLFAPWGTSLVLHTHTLLPSTIAAALPGGPIASTNAIVTLHLLLNGLCAYALAFRVTRRVPPAAAAAIVFGWSPYVAAHLAGHFNLIAAWVLPLFALLLLKSLADDGAGHRIVTGVVFAAIAYVDYYYFVYALFLALVILSERACHVVRLARPIAGWQRVAVGICSLLLALDLAALAVIATTGGGTTTILGASVSLRGVENPAAAAGLLVLLALALAFVPRLRVSIDPGVVAGDIARLAVPTGIAAMLLSPLAYAATSLWRHGGYVTQAYFWRSAPAGVDVATLLLGNPFGQLWGSLPVDVYRGLHVDTIEQIGWIGPGLLILAAAAVTLGGGDRRVRPWLAVSLVFGVWALGPRLYAFGRDLHVFLPGVLVRYVPMASNARMPGRAMVVVYLGAAMLTALGVETLMARGRGGIAWALVAMAFFDYLPRAPLLYRPDHPAIYDALARANGSGAVCELPMGLRDGFGETGRLDMRVLYYQTLHGRPITGGFVARLDPRVIAAYQIDPVLGVLLRLSAGAPLASQQTLPASLAGESLRLQGIRFVVVNHTTAPPDLVRYVESGLPLRAVRQEGERTLYELSLPINASLESRFR
jgi:hypothetical protein